MFSLFIAVIVFFSVHHSIYKHTLVLTIEKQALTLFHLFVFGKYVLVSQISGEMANTLAFCIISNVLKLIIAGW